MMELCGAMKYFSISIQVVNTYRYEFSKMYDLDLCRYFMEIYIYEKCTGLDNKLYGHSLQGRFFH